MERTGFREWVRKVRKREGSNHFRVLFIKQTPAGASLCGNAEFEVPVRHVSRDGLSGQLFRWFCSSRRKAGLLRKMWELLVHSHRSRFGCLGRIDGTDIVNWWLKFCIWPSNMFLVLTQNVVSWLVGWF